MRYLMPNPVKIGDTFYLRVRVPTDLEKKAKGTVIAAPVGNKLVNVTVGDAVKVSLRTQDGTEAKQRFKHVLVAIEEHWEALRNGPTRLTHKQCLALAGEARQAWIDAFDENPASATLWQNVKEMDAKAKAPATSLSVLNENLDRRFGKLADAALRFRGLNVDTDSRTQLIAQVALAMGEVADINSKKAGGDYSDSGETNKYPKYEAAKPSLAPVKSRDDKALTFEVIINEEVSRRALGRDAKPLPERTVRKYKQAAEEFAKFTGSDEALSVNPENVDSWKLSMLKEERLSTGTISQRLQNLSTVMEWGQQHTFGKLYLHKNPVEFVKRPQKQGIRSEDRTLRMAEARSILRAARKETNTTLRWLPWMMAYSGARVGELSQLVAKNFFEREGQWFFELTTKGGKSLKTEHSIRKVPVHPDLVKEGLIAFVQSQMGTANKRLFKTSAQQELANWVRETAGVKREEAAPNHGWRHLFEDIAMTAGMSEPAKLYITGRATGASAEGYGKSDAMLPGLYREMQKVGSFL